MSKRLTISVIIVCSTLAVLLLPGVLNPESGLICPAKAVAQETTPCLAQEATISSQEVDILRLQLTSSAQELQLLQMNATNIAQERTIVQMRSTLNYRLQPIGPQIVTVPVLITTTPPPSTRSAEESLSDTPTAVDSQVQIVRILNPGDITSEGVEIRNTGGVIALTGWTLEDSKGNIFIFPEQRLFTNGLITVYTRRGTNTPISLYWGQNQAVWNEAGETAVLSNQDGEVQSTHQLQ
ncbi:MAG: hypothetical protein CL610_27570 [Anaerolineaceae bacterium]|nr:hypothetical protein [Anaerolineaceae bacterium]